MRDEARDVPHQLLLLPGSCFGMFRESHKPFEIHPRLHLSTDTGKIYTYGRAVLFTGHEARPRVASGGFQNLASCVGSGQDVLDKWEV